MTRVELLLAAASVAFVVLMAEVGARLFVAGSWPEAKAHQLTHETETRGRFTWDEALGYRLTPDFEAPGFRHDERGFRSPPFRVPKPAGVRRVVLMGASTVYGIGVEDDETGAVRLGEELARRYPGRPVEVVNAGVPGWTSRETLLHLNAHVAGLEPDVVVMTDGRNEIFPQLWNDYRDDYSHYRRFDYDLRASNRPFKRLFRVSHLAMLVLASGRGRLGFSAGAEHPLYGSIRYDNRPTVDELAANLERPGIGATFEANLRRFVAGGRALGAVPVLATVPFRTEGYASSVLTHRPELLPSLEARARANNAATREVAAELAAPLVDLYRLDRERWLMDDCHFTPEGEREVGRMLADAVGPVLFASNEKPRQARAGRGFVQGGEAVDR